jgi:hypothetical protein
VNPQLPEVHVAVAFARERQPCPHAPQFDTLALRLISQPFTGLPSQSPKPLLHDEMPQTPAVHTADPFCGIGQVCPHEPQFATFAANVTSQPLAAWTSQSA